MRVPKLQDRVTAANLGCSAQSLNAYVHWNLRPVSLLAQVNSYIIDINIGRMQVFAAGFFI